MKTGRVIVIAGERHTGKTFLLRDFVDGGTIVNLKRPFCVLDVDNEYVNNGIYYGLPPVDSSWFEQAIYRIKDSNLDFRISPFDKGNNALTINQLQEAAIKACNNLRAGTMIFETFGKYRSKDVCISIIGLMIREVDVVIIINSVNQIPAELSSHIKTLILFKHIDRVNKNKMDAIFGEEKTKKISEAICKIKDPFFCEKIVFE